MIADSLFEGKTVRFASVDPEQDYPIESGWTYDLDYARHFREVPARPLAAAEMKKYYEKFFKESLEKGRQFHFALRMKADNRLVGFVRFFVLEWNHGVGNIVIALGEKDVRRAVEPESLHLALNYAFEELNLYRVGMQVPEYDYDRIEILESAGFQLEVRRKECYYRAGRIWDWLQYGLLVSEWQTGGK